MPRGRRGLVPTALAVALAACGGSANSGTRTGAADISTTEGPGISTTDGSGHEHHHAAGTVVAAPPVEPVTVPPAPSYTTFTLPPPPTTLAPAACAAVDGQVELAGRPVVLRGPEVPSRAPLVIVLHG